MPRGAQAELDVDLESCFLQTERHARREGGGGGYAWVHRPRVFCSSWYVALEVQEWPGLYGSGNSDFCLLPGAIAALNYYGKTRSVQQAGLRAPG